LPRVLPSALRLRGTSRSEVPKSTDFVTSLTPSEVASLRSLPRVLPSALRLRGTSRSEVPKSTDFVTSLTPSEVTPPRPPLSLRGG